ncbi:hypothetical protein [Nitrosospira sp. Is2]|uniref:Agd3-related carbohydrate deacetylase n=1 Tax=Nitrosospira sp. Is2 TaxID=3080532 RepID=UPI0029550253|nr:hypothetical protein [Nitrosospira sp. Is2]WON75267.1 hypothetical protein R5L00_07275 [Nitrosospira sp. Is2]
MGKRLIIKGWRFVSLAMWLGLIALAPPAIADNAVRLRILVITTGEIAEDMGFAYIKPFLDEIGVPYDVLNAATEDLTAAVLASSSTGGSCKAEDAGCVGNYNGIILTDADLVPGFTPSEWDILHNYQKNFGVRQAVLSGWPATYSDPQTPYGVYLDYGLVYSSSGTDYEGRWTVPASYGMEVFEYVNRANPFPITDFAFAANPRNDARALRDGSVPRVEPLLRTQNGEALLSIVRYMVAPQIQPVREVMISTITNAGFLVHSKVLAYEFINWVTHGVFVGARFVHMAVHVDDLFLPNPVWDTAVKAINPANTYRLNSVDVNNAVSKQAAFRAAHPAAGAFKLDFAFNGAGAVVDPKAVRLTANFADDLVRAVVVYKRNFRFINHTFTHAAMDKAGVRADAPCDYATFTSAADIRAEILKNRMVWGLLGLPDRSENNRVLVSGAHSGLKDRRCTDNPALHRDMFNVQADDTAFDGGGANPLFLEAAANTGVAYLAADSSQRAQNVEQYIAQYEDHSPMDRLMLPRWPTNIFYNVTNPAQLEDEYDHIYHGRFVNSGQNPCEIAGALCSRRSYAEILAVEADVALRHMLTFNRWPHFFHQTNLARYDESGNTLQFDWLNAVFTEYEQLLTLPVKNLPYYLIGDQTAARLNLKSAAIHATWDRETNQVMLFANKAILNLPVTGISGGELYGGQFVREVAVDNTPRWFPVDRALSH